jgi:hypothetical protein
MGITLKTGQGQSCLPALFQLVIVLFRSFTYRFIGVYRWQ